MTKAVNEGKHTELQAKLNAYVQEGYSLKKAAELAGYSKSYIQSWLKQIRKYVNWDEIDSVILERERLLKLKATDTAMDDIGGNDDKRHDTAMKYAGTVRRATAGDQGMHAPIFLLQTIQGETINVGSVGDKNQKEGEIVDVDPIESPKELESGENDGQ